ncbi:MAG: WG repeat-containing protein [Oscillospiraceae bacterium]|nr:WG repeat-containing protein [Oscillospiraceae bacterium]
MKLKRLLAAGLTAALLLSLPMTAWAEDETDGQDEISIIWLEDGLELCVTSGVETGDLLPVKNGEGLYGYVDLTGQVVIEPQYDDAASFSEGLARVELDGVISFIDLNGDVAFTLEDADSAGSFSCGRVWYEVDGLVGVADTEGNIILEPYYENIGGYSEDYTWVEANDLYGYIDLDGEAITNLIYGEAGSFHEGRACVWTEDEGYGYIDTSGELVVELQYTTATSFNDGYACVSLDGGFGFIDLDGNVVVELTLGYTDALYDGLAWSRDNDAGLYGFVDSMGQMVIEPEYNYASAFSGGLASVYDGEYFGYIDMEGNVVIPLEYKAVYRFSEGLGRVWDGTYYGFYNLDGELILPLEYDSAAAWNYVAVVEKDGLHGFFINPYYESVSVTAHQATRQLNLNWSRILRYGIFVLIALALIAAAVIPQIKSRAEKKALKESQRAAKSKKKK